MGGLKIIFMGTPEFSVGTLEALRKAGHEIVLVVTQPDKPKGRSGTLQYSPVKEAALAHDIPVFQPKKIRTQDSVDYLKTIKADVMVVIAFGQIFPKSILEMKPYGCINVHASLLPDYRGAAPIQWAILDGKKETGITTMQMDEGLDTGDMLLKTVVPIEEEETGGSLHDKLALAGARLCVETLEELQKGNLHPRKQGEMTTQYASMLKKEMGEISWKESSQVLDRKIRGLSPWPGCYTDLGDKQMKIWKAKPKTLEEVSERGISIPGASQEGDIVFVGKTSFVVKTGDGYLEILELQLSGKKRMDAGAFLRGYELEAGTRLGG